MYRGPIYLLNGYDLPFFTSGIIITISLTLGFVP